MASNFSPWSILGGGIGGAFQYAGGKAQADAQKEATQVQNQFNEKSLAAAQEQLQWQRAQYGNYLQRMQPYNQQGMAAGTTLSNLLARSPYAAFGNGARNAAPIYSQSQPGAIVPPAPALQKSVQT